MCVRRVPLGLSFLSFVLILLAISAGSASAQNVLHVYGSEGPYPAIREAAVAFGTHHGVDLEVVGKPINKWLDNAKGDADLIYSSAEFMMINLVRDMEGRIDETSITPLYWRPAAILVRPDNTKHIYSFPDLLRPSIKVMVVNGSGQTGLWEDIAGRQGNFRTVRALRDNIVLYAPNSTDARRMWLARKDIDAWLTWNIWYKADSRNSALIPLSADYAIYRQCSIALTRQGGQKPMAEKFVEFLTSHDAAAIFAKWGWITTSEEATPAAARTVIRIVHDVQEDEWEFGIGKGLTRIHKLVADYDSLGVPKSEVNISLVLHGGAAYWVLKDGQYGAFAKTEGPNPNKSVIHELAEWGVSIELCGQTMKRNGWIRADILPDVKIVSGVCPRIVQLERQGYLYIGL